MAKARGDMRRIDNDTPNIQPSSVSNNGYSILQPSGNSVESDGNMTWGSSGSITFKDAAGEIGRPRQRRHGGQARKKTSQAQKLIGSKVDWVSEDVKTSILTKSIDVKTFPSNKVSEEDATLDIKRLVDATHLTQAGCNQEGINQMVYDHMGNHELPNFLKHLHLDEDGGLDRIKDLWSNQKIFWAFILFAFVILNVWYLLSSNWTVFNGFCKHVIKSQSSLMEVMLEQTLSGKLDLTNLTFATEDIDSGIDDFSKAASASGNTTEVDIFMHIQDPRRRDMILKMAGVAGTCEVVWVLFFIMYIFYEIGVFLCSKSEYKAYTSILHVFQDSLPLLSTFSLMKFMGSVHPALIYNMYLDHVNNAVIYECGMGSIGVKICSGVSKIYWVFTRIVLASLALFAFSMKLLSVGLKLIDPSHGFGACLIAAFGFMNQCMGCVLFERVLQERIFLFIFGGADTDFTEDELALKAVYRCRMAKQIWEYFRNEKKDLFKAIIMFATLDHYDIQRLLINEEWELPERMSQSSRLDTSRSGRSATPTRDNSRA